jgi:hypothetical protein
MILFTFFITFVKQNKVKMNNVKNVFSIKDLENLSGIKAHTIRIWEKRYNVLEPMRSDTNIRSYDIKNLQKLLTDLTQQLELLQREFEIIFCLDGTNDNSKTIISIFSQKYKITILPESNKRGLGIA